MQVGEEMRTEDALAPEAFLDAEGYATQHV
jgi:hypothetical protein